MPKTGNSYEHVSNTITLKKQNKMSEKHYELNIIVSIADCFKHPPL